MYRLILPAVLVMACTPEMDSLSETNRPAAPQPSVPGTASIGSQLAGGSDVPGTPGEEAPWENSFAETPGQSGPAVNESLAARPLHLVMVVDVGPENGFETMEAARQAVGLAASELRKFGGPNDVFGVVIHTDRHAYSYVQPTALLSLDQEHPVVKSIFTLQGCAVVDMESPQPFAQPTNMPFCFADEAGVDPAVGLRAAYDMLEQMYLVESGVHAHRSVVMIGAGETRELGNPGLRPSDYLENWQSVVLHDGAWTSGALAAAAQAESYALEDLDADVSVVSLGATPNVTLMEGLVRGEGAATFLEAGHGLNAVVRDAVHAADDIRRRQD